MRIAHFDTDLLMFSTQHFEVRRERLGNQLLASVVVVGGVALEPVERLAGTGNRLAGRRRKVPDLRAGPLRRAALVLLLKMQEAAVLQNKRTVERLAAAFFRNS